MESSSENVEPSGLSETEVGSRLKQHGYNELPSSKGRNIFATAWDVVREPMFLLLLACGTIYLILGDVQEALMLLGFVFVALGITLYQERKTERALEALRDLSSPRALVIRGGERKRIAGREVVLDDIVVLAEGDRVPADSVLLSSNNLSTDESLLTGESVPVRKVAWDEVREMTRPGGEDLPFVFSGTLIVQGQGIAQVRSTGVHTEMGNIGKALQTVTVEGTRLQREVGRLVQRVAILGLALCAIVVVLYGLTRGNWLQGFIVFEAEPEEANVMRRPPRNSKESLFGKRLFALGLLQGASVLLIVIAVYLAALFGWLKMSDATALSFTTLVVANLGLIFANRSWTRTIWSTLRTPNAALWWVLGGTTFFLGLALYVPFLRHLFHFSTLHPVDLALCLAGGFVSILWFESLKLFKWNGRKTMQSVATIP